MAERKMSTVLSAKGAVEKEDAGKAAVIATGALAWLHSQWGLHGLGAYLNR